MKTIITASFAFMLTSVSLASDDINQEIQLEVYNPKFKDNSVSIGLDILNKDDLIGSTEIDTDIYVFLPKNSFKAN